MIVTYACDVACVACLVGQGDGVPPFSLTPLPPPPPPPPPITPGRLHVKKTHDGKQGWPSGESTRPPPMWPGFDSRTRRHMWVEFVVGSLPCSERFFSGTSVFPSPQKPTIPHSNSIWRVSRYCKAHLIISSWNYALYKFTN